MRTSWDINSRSGASAGQNSLVIRADGTGSPRSAMYSATHDWGTVENYKFDVRQLNGMEKSCNPHRLSTCQHTLRDCYSTRRMLKWLFMQALDRFHCVTGSF